MKNKLRIAALLSAVSGATLMQNPVLANDVNITEPEPSEYCQYQLIPSIHIEDPAGCVNIEPTGAPYST